METMQKHAGGKFQGLLLNWNDNFEDEKLINID